MWELEGGVSCDAWALTGWLEMPCAEIGRTQGMGESWMDVKCILMMIIMVAVAVD